MRTDTGGTSGDMVDLGTTVLIADDDVSFASFARTALASIGATAQTVGDGDACLRAARESPPDAILLDLFMPGLDGLEVLRRLRADPDTADLPVLLLTGLPTGETLSEARAGGADDVLFKPFMVADLLERVRRLLDGHRTSAREATA